MPPRARNSTPNRVSKSTYADWVESCDKNKQNISERANALIIAWSLSARHRTFVNRVRRCQGEATLQLSRQIPYPSRSATGMLSSAFQQLSQRSLTMHYMGFRGQKSMGVGL